MSDCVPLSTNSVCEIADLRRSPRVYCHIPVHLRTTDDRYFDAECTDLCEGGIGLDSQRVLSVGQRIHLLVGTFSVPMMVIYRIGDHYGLSALAGQEQLLQLLPRQ